MMSIMILLSEEGEVLCGLLVDWTGLEELKNVGKIFSFRFHGVLLSYDRSQLIKRSSIEPIDCSSLHPNILVFCV